MFYPILPDVFAWCTCVVLGWGIDISSRRSVRIACTAPARTLPRIPLNNKFLHLLLDGRTFFRGQQEISSNLSYSPPFLKGTMQRRVKIFEKEAYLATTHRSPKKSEISTT